MTKPSTCPDCGNPIPADSPYSQCPHCLLQHALSAAGTQDEPPGEALPISAKSTPTGTRPGDVVRYMGDYELLEEIARGGMGVVYRARQVSLNRPVAVKMILSGQLASERDVRRFHQEAEAVANLQHPNIVAIHEVGEQNGLHYFSMDLVEGQDLAKVLRRGPMDPRDAAALLRKVSSAVAYAHRHGILHRDLKPSNVLVGADGDPQVTDFGLAKRQEAASGLTVSGAVLGTPSYMAPEQVEGRLEEIDRRTDVFGLGAILYETLTGRPPFVGDAPMVILKQVVEKDPTPPSQLNAAVPRDLEAVCLKCLQKNAVNRYQTATELTEDLDRFLQHQPVRARPPARVLAWMDWIRNNPWVVANMLAIAVACLGTGAYLFWENSRAVLWRANHPGASFPEVAFLGPLEMRGQDSSGVMMMLFVYLLLGPAGLLTAFASMKTASKLSPRALVLFMAIACSNLVLGLAAMFRAAHCSVWNSEDKGFMMTLGLIVLPGFYFSLQLLGLVGREFRVWRFGDRKEEAQRVYGAVVMPGSSSASARGFRRPHTNLFLLGCIVVATIDALSGWMFTMVLGSMMCWGAWTCLLVMNRTRLITQLRASAVSRQVGSFLVLLALPIYILFPVTMPGALSKLTRMNPLAAYLITAFAVVLGVGFQLLWQRYQAVPPEATILDDSRFRIWARKKGKGEDLVDRFIGFGLLALGLAFQPLAVFPPACGGAVAKGIVLCWVGGPRERLRILGTAVLCVPLLGLAFLYLPRPIWWSLAAVGFLIGSVLTLVQVSTLSNAHPKRRPLLVLCAALVLIAGAGVAWRWADTTALYARQRSTMRVAQLQQMVQLQQLILRAPAPSFLEEIRDLYAQAGLAEDGIRYFSRLERSPASSPATRFKARWTGAQLLDQLGQTHEVRVHYVALTTEYGLVNAHNFRVSPSYAGITNHGFATAYPPETTGVADVALPWAEPNPSALRFPGYLDLSAHFGSLGEPISNRVAYAHLTIVSPRATAAHLALGSSDDLVAWWNGERVLSRNYDREAQLDADVVRVQLKQGRNALLVKVCNRTGDWGLLVRILDRDGQPIKDLEYP